MSMQIVWCVTGHSESGDDYGPWLFDKKPTQKQLKKMLKEDCPNEWDDEGPGAFGSYVHLKGPFEVSIIEL